MEIPVQPRYSTTQNMHVSLLSSRVPGSLPELIDILIANRQVNDAPSFFSPPHPNEITAQAVGIDPKELDRAVALCVAVGQQGKTIVIFGDYDADGICATATLWQCLHAAGIRAFPFIPDRHRHGYGLTVKGIDELIEQYHPDLLITVDNGIVAHDALQYAAERNLQVIVSDHHQKEVDGTGVPLPIEAAAVIHTTALCGTTVAWMLGRALHAEAALNALDLAALATIADQVPLVAHTRAFAFHGLEALRESTRPGLLALLTLAGIEQATLTEQEVSFGLAPRINAMGRLSHGLDALRLLCTQQETTAEKLAMRLQTTNTERQDLTKEQFAEALRQVEGMTDEHVLVAYSSSFHEGVIGLIASKLTEKFHKPSIVMAVKEQVVKGSARSVRGVNITTLLRSVREELLEVGGHPMAGGFSLEAQKITVFSKKLQEKAREEIVAESLEQTTQPECILPFPLCSVKTVEKLRSFAPFGSGNTKPIFLFPQVIVTAAQTLGRDGNHIKLTLQDGAGAMLTALWWGGAEACEAFPIGSVVDVVAELTINEWKQKKTPQLIVKALWGC